ncbi:MAG: di-heme-cytochrome C peroxidase [Acidobacteriota bacterium]|nr:di-heme-cytochrome C peroxidase [Acidobacteriota bacterium]
MPVTFEQKLPSEDEDIAEITRAILKVQARYAGQQHRALGRGTHTKGVCCRASFQIFDVPALVSEPAMGARLARGVFAQPGIYPATVRFANAASTLQPDSEADVRALSFSIDVPGGPAGPVRHDFTMNNAPVFPINNAHDFAALMRVRAEDGGLAQALAFFKLPFMDMLAVLRTAKLGKQQQNQPLRPYQQTRFWSNVPFQHGPDEAIKYSAIPGAGNAGRAIAKGESVLRDELARHLASDEPMAYFDFGLQLLDAAAMTHGGKTRDASFWIENAVADWDETQAPFHVVARLTLERGSLTPGDQCAAAYIDVTEYSLPESRPIGSINRARWPAESSSRKARMASSSGAEMSEASSPEPVRPRRFGSLLDLRLRSVVRVALAIVLGVCLAVFGFALITVIRTNQHSGTLPDEAVAEVVYPDQGWGEGVSAAGRQTYYYTAQGAGLKDLRYSWFVHLEMPLSHTSLRSQLDRFGFLIDGASGKNPDALPVGFSKHFDRELNEELVDITCAACHTGQINVTRDGRTTALRIDGGSAIHAFTDSNLGHFVPTLMSALASTAFNPLKFARFADRVLGEDHDTSQSLALHRQMMNVLGQLGSMGVTEWWHDLVPTEEGYGRTDALARIANTVFGDHLGAGNYKPGNAPVNYPPVWNIWKFDWVQYNASVSQPMARNIGESMGTGSKYLLTNRYGQPLPAHERFRTSAIIENLHTIEVTLRSLQAPKWDERVLGPIDWPRAEEGKKLFNEHCVGCHGPHLAPPSVKIRNAPLKTAADPEWLMRTVCVDDIGTDRNTAANFFEATVDISRTGLTKADLQSIARRTMELKNQRTVTYLDAEIARLSALPQTPEMTREVGDRRAELAGVLPAMERTLDGLDPRQLKVGAALSYLGTLIRDTAYADARYTPAEAADRDGFGVFDTPEVLLAYKPRPLGGMWASAPFLHNGSVPTIYDLLSPVEERPRTFRVGSREFDTAKLGLVDKGDPYWVFDVSKPGNSHRGHEFSGNYQERPWATRAKDGVIGPLLTPAQRLALIEHLKVRNDDVDGPKEPHVPQFGQDCTKGAGPARSYARR